MKDEVITLILVALGTAKVFAQDAPVSPGLVSLVGNVGIVAVLIWHLWYHTTHSYPKMLTQFAAETKLLREAFASEVQQLRTTFAIEQQALRDYTSKEAEHLRGMLIQNLQAMRTAVHDVRDTAQAAIGESRLAKAAVEKVKKIAREEGDAS